MTENYQNTFSEPKGKKPEAAPVPLKNTSVIQQATDTNAKAAEAAKSKTNIMREIVSMASVKKQLESVLKENAGSFIASLITLYSSDTYLQQCDPQAVYKEAVKAAVLKLPIEKSLGFAWVIPRRVKGVMTPVFQIGTKGYVQLAQRTGAYASINAGNVYEGELKVIDKISGDIDISGEPTSDVVIGYFAYIRTVNGFSKTLYWSLEKALKHAQTFSDSFKHGNEIWTKFRDEMFQKTVLKALLSKWGIMSIEMQNAVNYENADAADAAIVDDTPFPPPPIQADGSVDLETGEITPVPLLIDATLT